MYISASCGQKTFIGCRKFTVKLYLGTNACCFACIQCYYDFTAEKFQAPLQVFEYVLDNPYFLIVYRFFILMNRITQYVRSNEGGLTRLHCI